MTTSSDSTPGGLSMEPVRCPKCNGEMLQGFIADFQGSKFCRVSNWVEGAPGKPTWFGTCVPAPAEKCVPIVPFVVQTAASSNHMHALNSLQGEQTITDLPIEI